MFGSLFPSDLLAELDRLQRQFQPTYGITPTIRGVSRGGFPALNVGATAQSVEIFAFAPGLDPATVEVNLDRGVLSITGERTVDLPPPDASASVHINERFRGRFRRVLSMPDDVDPNAVTASYRDGILHVSARRRSAAQPRRVEIQ